jgi:hypothetical protein
MRLRFLIAVVVVASVALLVPSAQAQGRGGCVSLQANVHGSLLFPPDVGPIALPNGAWVVEADFLIGGDAHQGVVVFDLTDTVTKKGFKNIFLGFEQGLVTLDDGTTFEMVGHFASPHQVLPIGPWTLNESGTITGDGISGQYTEHGIYGFDVPPVNPNGLLGFIGWMRGTICGL